MKKKIIIIGGGIAGLSAGIYALKAGYDAEIYEKNAKADSFYTSTYDGQSVTLWNDLSRTRKNLIEAAPEDEEEIRKIKAS